MRGRLSTLLLLLSSSGCGTDIAQTAFVPGEKALDCSPATAPVVLPSEPRLGGDDSVTPSLLAGGDYGAGQGPGVAVVARDGFRLYQNGSLLAESAASLVPVFVPLTFLPGQNALVVVATSPDRAPLVLVQIDELERAHASDGSWKVSTDPVGDFQQPGYDDASWANAKDYGLALANSGCEPPAGFVSGSTAHWIGPSSTSARTAVFRFAFRIAPIGFGEATTGGEGSAPVVAESWDDLVALLERNDEPRVVLLPEGTLDVRRTGAEVFPELACPVACDDGSGKLTYLALPTGQVCDTALVPIPRAERRLAVGSNKTLVGLGRGAALRGASLYLGASQNVIVRNLALFDVNPTLVEAGDGITVEGGSRVWVDHTTFKWLSDGFVDVGVGSSELTLSWLLFDGENDAACSGRHLRANELTDASATFHHTFWNHVDGRAPLANRELCRVHLFDNLVSDDPDYAVGATCGAQVLLEGSTFESVRFPTSKRSCSDDARLGRIQAPPGSNAYSADSGPHQEGTADGPEPHDPVFSPAYAYRLDDPAEAHFTVRERAGAGARWALPLTR